MNGIGEGILSSAIDLCPAILRIPRIQLGMLQVIDEAAERTCKANTHAQVKTIAAI